MSSDSALAAFRKADVQKEIAQLAEQHLQHDLQQSDRDTLKAAAGKLSTYASIGSVVGIGLGVTLAYRLRQNRVKMFEAFKTARKPTHVKFADGAEEPIPDITPYIAPSTAGDILTYTFFSLGGLFIGGELGLLTGSVSARRRVAQDPQSRARIEKAFRAFRADMLKSEIRTLEGGEGSGGWGLM